MGVVSEKLKKRLLKEKSRKVVSLHDLREARSAGEKVAEHIKSINSSDTSPLHKIYTTAHNFVSTFAEQAATFPEFDDWYDMERDYNEFYMPLGPPMSPLTTSYFVLWAINDFQFGQDNESMSSCLLDMAEIIGIDKISIQAIENLSVSRMGLYEHKGNAGDLIKLKELITEKEIKINNYSGYSGKKGELWFIRILPNFFDNEGASVAITTPYILLFSKKKWVEFLISNGIKKGERDVHEKLHHFLKFGPAIDYWHEFVVESYVNHKPSHIYLTGVPDKKETLPHAGIS